MVTLLRLVQDHYCLSSWKALPSCRTNRDCTKNSKSNSLGWGTKILAERCSSATTMSSLLPLGDEFVRFDEDNRRSEMSLI
ncbi:unnamed protein product [Cuscuta campestris]|uniref:Uncharacterized protein n=1 Tax=Cuscuta campestris TaxID=132261 RepID=A0A484LE07_9ASTE|nr:unnamed protein product [Cuscuta campestris]